MSVIEEAKRNVKNTSIANTEVASVVLSDEYIAAMTTKAETMLKRKLTADELTEAIIAEINRISRKHRLPEYMTLSSYPDCIEKPYRSVEEAVKLYNANKDEIEDIMTEIAEKAEKDFADRELIDTVIPYELPDIMIDTIRYSDMPAVEAIRCNLYKEIEKNLIE